MKPILVGYFFMATMLVHVLARQRKSVHRPKVVIVFSPKLNLLKMLRTGDIYSRKAYDYKKEKEERKKAKLVHEQHRRKIRELNEYMKSHMISTNYFYDEMKRILKMRKVKNNLRRMVEYLEKHGNEEIRRKVIKCFLHYRQQEISHYNVYNHHPNNLVINVLQDPYNDGVLN